MLTFQTLECLNNKHKCKLGFGNEIIKKTISIAFSLVKPRLSLLLHHKQA